MSYPPVPITAGQDITAGNVNAMSRFVATMTMGSVSSSASEVVVGTVIIPSTDAGLAQNGGYQLWFFGVASCTGTPTLSMRVRLGSVTGALLVGFSGITCSSGGSNMRVVIDMEMMITASGSSGTFDCMATMRSNLASTATTVANFSGTPASAINTTTAQTLVVTAQWGTSSSSNTMTGDVGSLDRI